MMQLVPRLGREQAQRVVAEALQQLGDSDTTFVKALGGNAAVAQVLSSSDLAALENPASYLGAAETFRRALLESARS
jgi:adenylosuccinate lyase